ncbi:MAG: hypothetical protein A7316_04935 [Candidatus Altiarchaeales archaeon WOR_SM1_86-2]|nr:MAG: hypothetical protein A7316_04935 [Candidatus Altiarchaeales archaeon WOR_SM1_86-2]
MFAGFVDGYEIEKTYSENHTVNSIFGIHTLTKNGSLESSICMNFQLVDTDSDKRPQKEIDFIPWDRPENIPEPSVLICECSSGGCCSIIDNHLNYECKRIYPYNFSYNFSNVYRITFVPEKTEKEAQYFAIMINYTLPDFTIKQGDYNVVRLSLKNHLKYLDTKGKPIQNIIVLPSQDDIPRFLPDAGDIRIVKYRDENGNNLNRWAFVFDGSGDKIIWYWNEKKIKEREIINNLTYLGMGFLLSLLAGTIVYLSLGRNPKDFFRINTPEITKKQIFDTTTKKFKSEPVIGSITGKTYHKINCKWVNNIAKENKRQFENKDVAEKEGYKPCRNCNPDD